MFELANSLWQVYFGLAHILFDDVGKLFNSSDPEFPHLQNRCQHA